MSSEPTPRPSANRGWVSIGDTLTTGQANDEQAETRDHVLALARAWFRGELPRSGVRQQSTVHERRTAIRFTAPGSDDFRVLMALLDELVDHEHELTGEFVYATKHGIFTRSELDSASARITPTANPDGLRPGSRIVFPVRVDANGNATYLETQQQRWAYANSPRSETPRVGIADRWNNR